MVSQRRQFAAVPTGSTSMVETARWNAGISGGQIPPAAQPFIPAYAPPKTQHRSGSALGEAAAAGHTCSVPFASFPVQKWADGSKAA